MLRSTHDQFMAIMEANVKALQEVIEAQKKLIEDKSLQIQSLESILTSPKCNDYTSEHPRKSKSDDSPVLSRGGWRTRSELHSKATIPVVGDSVKALEDRVAREGGKV